MRVPSQLNLTYLTLGNVYDLNLKKNEALIREVIVQAQGEMALEEYIKQVKETWTNYTLDLVNYQNRCRLIRYVPIYWALFRLAETRGQGMG